MSQNESDRERSEDEYDKEDKKKDESLKQDGDSKYGEESRTKEIKEYGSQESEDINRKILKDLKMYQADSSNRMSQEGTEEEEDEEEEEEEVEDHHSITIDRDELETLRSYRNICLNIRDNLEQIKSSKKVWCRCMVHGAQYMVHGPRYMVHSTWCMVHGTWCTVQY